MLRLEVLPPPLINTNIKKDGESFYRAFADNLNLALAAFPLQVILPMYFATPLFA